MRRRREHDDGSLDLLLDTICNTFGGVLFISLLVVVLLNWSSSQAALTPPSDERQQELRSANRELAETAAELNKLHEQLTLQQETERLLDYPNLAEMLHRLQTAEQLLAARRDENNRLVDGIGKSQIETNSILGELKTLEEQIAQARKSLEQEQRRLRREQQLRTRSAKLPRLREMNKNQIALLLRGGRLYEVTKRAKGTDARNDADCRFEEKDGVQRVFARPERGRLIVPADGGSDVLAQILSAYDQDKDYVALVVWPDSFAEFHVVRETLVRGNFNYNVIPWPRDDGVTIGESDSIDKAM